MENKQTKKIYAQYWIEHDCFRAHIRIGNRRYVISPFYSPEDALKAAEAFEPPAEAS